MRILLLMCAIVVASSCSRAPEALPTTQHFLSHDSIEREYFVYLPSAYGDSAARPLVVFMHGYGGTATGTEAEVTQGLNFYAEAAGYIAVYPQSTWFETDAGGPANFTVSSWNHISDGFDRGPSGPICEVQTDPAPCPPECGDCGQCGWASCHDDVGFLRALVAELREDYRVEQVFIAGFSNGAMMAHRAACEASDLFSAVMLIGGRVEPGFECAPIEPLPMLQVNGGADLTVPADGSLSDGGYRFASTESVTEHWLGGAVCAAESTEWQSAAVEGTTAVCSIHCPDDPAAVVDCLWPEGNHRWPGTPGFRGSNGYCVSQLQADSMPQQQRCIAPDPTADTWGSALMFEFFDEHRGNVAER